MAVSTALDPGQPSSGPHDKPKERRALGVACTGHVLHDGYTDLTWVALPIWQAEFALSYAAVGTLRMIYTGTMAGLLRALETGTEPDISGRDNLRTIALCEAVLKSAREHRAVTLEEITNP